jgi:predicted P-loop ATPase
MILISSMPELAGNIAYNEFSNNITIVGDVPFLPATRTGTEWRNGDDASLTGWLQVQRFNMSIANIKASILPASRYFTFNPVKEYLEGLQWDNKQRIGAWLTTYLSVEASEYSMAVGKRWLISAVSRILDPGCQADCMLVLEGDQGIRKSTAMRILGGEYFTDELAGLGTKDSSQQLQGAWIIEMSELDTLTKSEAAEAKAFISRRVDRFRPPYGSVVEKFPRQCIFCGTVNQDTYFKDETGGRRFWPVKCSLIDVEQLAQDRDQIWAEAVECYKRGDVVYLDTKDLEEAAAEEVRKREHVDVWHDSVMDYIGVMAEVTQTEILDHLEIPTGQRNNGHSIRINRIMLALDFKKIRKRTGVSYEREGF